jgi:hypothetical protein
MTTVWDEWGALTRFLESARLAFARERRLWHSLELKDRETVSITSPSGESGTYKVTLDQHIAAVDDEEVLFAAVLIHSYALTEAAVCDRLGLDSRSAGGIEKWAADLLAANGRSWADVFDGEAGAVEVAVIRNAFAHGSRLVDSAGEARLRKVGSTLYSAGDRVALSYDQVCKLRVRLRSILRYGGIDPHFARPVP